MESQSNESVKREYKSHFTQAITGVMNRTEDIIMNSSAIDYIAIDNGFLPFIYEDNFRKHDTVYRWMEGILKDFTRMESKVADFTPYRYHRLITIPKPELITNNSKRRFYREAVKSNLHYHLSHGVNCYALFIDTSKYKNSRIKKDDIITLTNGLTYDCSEIYSLKSFTGFKEVNHKDSKEFVRKYFNQLQKEDFNNSLQLLYDNKTFQNIRRNDAQKRTVYSFIYQLYSGICQGTDCAQKVEYNEKSTDHIYPIDKANNTIINFTLLCDKCNKYKSNFIFNQDPYRDALIHIPAELSGGVSDIFKRSYRPEWLSKIRKPPVDIRKYIKKI